VEYYSLLAITYGERKCGDTTPYSLPAWGLQYCHVALGFWPYQILWIIFQEQFLFCQKKKKEKKKKKKQTERGGKKKKIKIRGQSGASLFHNDDKITMTTIIIRGW
jgi:hypothetical protein